MHDIPRVGLYINKRTRCRLNLFKAELALKVGRTVSQSEAMDALLDLAGIPRPAQPGQVGQPVQAPEALALPEPQVEHVAL